MGFQLGLDTGGTYTDAVLIDETRTVRASAKSLTTHRELLTGLGDAVDSVLSTHDAGDIELVCLSTTLATNALVEGRGRRVALILAGFTQSQLQRADLSSALGTDPLLLVDGGHKASGIANAKLDVSKLEEFVSGVDHQVDAYAVSSIFSVRNPEHELQAQSVIQTLSGKPVVCGHHLSSGLDAPRRALTALLNARLIPMINTLLDAALLMMLERNIKAPLMVVKGDGSLISDSVARRLPVETILSGPAASVVGAQFLCGEQNMLISDMGGTTTDVALIRDAMPRLNADGATVGGWRTMVNAIEICTYGLGGDSALVFDRGLRDFSLATNRVLPISLLIHEHPHCLAMLEAQLDLPVCTTHCGQFVMVHSANPTDLSFAQQELFERISDGPIAVQTLFEDQTLERALRRLEQRGIVIRSAFTPTDAAHLAGVQSTWQCRAAEVCARLLIRYSGDNLGPVFNNVQEFALSVLRKTSERTAAKLIDAVSNFSGKSLTDSQRVLIENSVVSCSQSSSTHALFSLQPRLDIPLVGLGAPAASYYPLCADLLETRIHLPDLGHVANALGAVVGTIRQQQNIMIIPAGGKQVSVMFAEGPELFDTLEEGVLKATARASELATEKALYAGAVAPAIDISRQDKSVADGDSEVFFESCITATATGRPECGA